MWSVMDLILMFDFVKAVECVLVSGESIQNTCGSWKCGSVQILYLNLMVDFEI